METFARIGVEMPPPGITERAATIQSRAERFADEILRLISQYERLLRVAEVVYGSYPFYYTSFMSALGIELWNAMHCPLANYRFTSDEVEAARQIVQDMPRRVRPDRAVWMRGSGRAGRFAAAAQDFAEEYKRLRIIALEGSRGVAWYRDTPAQAICVTLWSSLGALVERYRFNSDEIAEAKRRILEVTKPAGQIV